MSGHDVGTKWRHYKGNVYQILAIARHEGSGEELVIYREIPPDPNPERVPKPWSATTWARGVKEWSTPVLVGDIWEPRFTRIGA